MNSAGKVHRHYFKLHLSNFWQQENWILWRRGVCVCVCVRKWERDRYVLVCDCESMYNISKWIRSFPETTETSISHTHTQTTDYAVPIWGVLANQWNWWNVTKSMVMLAATLYLKTFHHAHTLIDIISSLSVCRKQTQAGSINLESATLIIKGKWYGILR